jgi:4'-phosphopantetheinyl transferase
MVAIGCSCGVDIEQLRAIDNPLALATDVFASSELVQMRNLSGERLIERFYSLWTLKEAYLKARGTGLTEPLDAVAFDWDDDRILPSFKDEWMEVRRQWTFTLRRPTPSHVLAAAVAGVPTASSDIPIHWLVPLRGLYAAQQALSGSFSA